MKYEVITRAVVVRTYIVDADDEKDAEAKSVDQSPNYEVDGEWEETQSIRPYSAQETSSALVCRHGVDTGKKRCLQCYPLQGDKFDPVAEDVQMAMDRDRE